MAKPIMPKPYWRAIERYNELCDGRDLTPEEEAELVRLRETLHGYEMAYRRQTTIEAIAEDYKDALSAGDLGGTELT